MLSQHTFAPGTSAGTLRNCAPGPARVCVSARTVRVRYGRPHAHQQPAALAPEGPSGTSKT
uniref:Uncharacterized protein n=1 Tax=Anopheles quadriannulatus TaxID=34691 RepID=A0A182XEF5_ANOQN